MLRIFLAVILCSLYAGLNYASIRHPFIPGVGLLALWTLILPGVGTMAASAYSFLAFEKWSHRILTALAALVFFGGCAGLSLGYIFTAWATI